MRPPLFLRKKKYPPASPGDIYALYQRSRSGSTISPAPEGCSGSGSDGSGFSGSTGSGAEGSAAPQTVQTPSAYRCPRAGMVSVKLSPQTAQVYVRTPVSVQVAAAVTAET